MNKYDLIQEELAKGGSYHQEILKLLCEITEKLGKLLIEKPETFLTRSVEEVRKEEILPIKRKRGRPPKRR